MMQAEPQKEHEWLLQLVGDWTFEVEGEEPGKEPMKASGTETVRSLGDLWVVGEGEGDMPDGTPGTTQLTLGYDPSTQRFVGTWIGSMMTHMWVYDGELDDSGRVLVLDSEGPSMSGGPAKAKYQDVIEIEDDDTRLLRSRVLGDDGDWHEFMTARYRRR